MDNNKLGIACDHAGYELKELSLIHICLNEVEEKNFNVTLTHKLGFGKCRILSLIHISVAERVL